MPTETEELLLEFAELVKVVKALPRDAMEPKDRAVLEAKLADSESRFSEMVAPWKGKNLPQVIKDAIRKSIDSWKLVIHRKGLQ